MKPLSCLIYTTSVLLFVEAYALAQPLTKPSEKDNQGHQQKEDSASSANPPSKKSDTPSSETEDAELSELDKTVQEESKSGEEVKWVSEESALESVDLADKSSARQLTHSVGSVPSSSGSKTPESPVSVILNLSGREIQKPNAVKPLSISFAKSFTATESSDLPLNLSVEAAPYWLDSHSTVDWKAYSDSGIEQLYQNLTLSLGTSTTNINDAIPVPDDAFSVTRLAFGMRTGIDSRAYYCEQLTPLYRQYRNGVSKAKLQAMDAAVSSGRYLQSFDSVDQQYRQNWLSDEENAEALEKATTLCTRKRGWALDMAFASAFVVPDQVFDDTELSALSGWLTFGFLGDTLSFVPMARIRSDQLDVDDSSTVMDFGGQLVLAAKMLAFSVEFVYRQVLDKSDVRDDDGYYRTGLAIDAALSESVWLNLSLGKDYADLIDQDLFVITSLQFDLGKRIIGLDPEEVDSEYQ